MIIFYLFLSFLFFIIGFLFFRNKMYLDKLDYLCELFFLIIIQNDLTMYNSDKLLFFEQLLKLRNKFIILVYNSLSIFMIFSLLTIFKNKENLLFYIGLKFDEQISKRNFLGEIK